MGHNYAKKYNEKQKEKLIKEILENKEKDSNFSLIKYVREKGIKENTFRYWLKSTYKHLLTEMPKHIYDKDKSYVLDLLPWSDKLPSEVKTDTEYNTETIPYCWIPNIFLGMVLLILDLCYFICTCGLPLTENISQTIKRAGEKMYNDKAKMKSEKIKN